MRTYTREIHPSTQNRKKVKNVVIVVLSLGLYPMHVGSILRSLETSAREVFGHIE